MLLRIFTAIALISAPASAFARNIVLTNDDGLTSNVHALYHALKKQGHDVIVSVPCTGQSGMGAAIKFMRPLGPLKADCLNMAGKAGDPGAGPMTRAGFAKDFFYVDGTPIMSLLYGLDIAAKKRWGKAPDLVLSGPNQGQNVGYVVLNSGTVSNVQFAATRGLPAIALSAGEDTADNENLANPKSATVAAYTLDLLRSLDTRAGDGPMLPAGLLLNVNFPKNLEGAKWRPARIGSYNMMQFHFTENLANSASPEMAAAAKAHGMSLPNLPGIGVSLNKNAPRKDQKNDEAVVFQTDISVSVMQLGYEPKEAAHKWLGINLPSLFAQ